MLSGLMASKNELDQIKQLFISLDKDKSGRISASELNNGILSANFSNLQ